MCAMLFIISADLMTRNLENSKNISRQITFVSSKVKEGESRYCIRRGQFAKKFSYPSSDTINVTCIKYSGNLKRNQFLLTIIVP